MTREEAIKTLRELWRETNDHWYEETYSMAIEALERMPSADVQPVRHGHWINHPDDLFPEDSSIECSVCHEYEYATANDNFCGNCGAKMDEAEQDG